MMFSLLALKFLNWLSGLFTNFDFSTVTDLLKSVSEAINIFAWLNYLLPVNVLLSLLGLTTAYYSVKFLWSLIMRLKDFIF